MKSENRMNPDLRRAQIMNEGSSIIMELGVAETTISRIAKNISVSRSLIEKYYGNRSKLLRAIAEHAEANHDLAVRLRLRAWGIQ